MIEVIIACHNPNRDIWRAVRSVLIDNAGSATVTIVCHNVDTASIRSKIPTEHHNNIRFTELHDGIHSPAGPFNFGITHATEEWVAIMGSDDYLAPGALKKWQHLAQAYDADAVIARVEENGTTVPAPPVRVFHSGVSDALRDRLFYRSAPLGLMRKQFLLDHNLLFTPHLSSGEDIDFTFRLWLEGRIVAQRRGPGYVVGTNATDRVTFRMIPVVEEFAHMGVVWKHASTYSHDIQRALALKYLRIHVFSYAYLRATTDSWDAFERKELKAILEDLLRYAPEALGYLSRADKRLVDGLLDLTTDKKNLTQWACERRQFWRPTTWIASQLTRTLSREAPMRYIAASLCTRLIGDYAA